MRDVFEHVEPRDALLGEQARRLGLRLLENGGADVSGLHLLPLRALHVQHGGLQHPAERRRLFGLPLLAARDLHERFVEVGVEVAPQPLQVRAARDQDALAVGIVRERVQQMLERDVRMPAGDGLPIGDGEDDFDGGGEHRYSVPRIRAIVYTLVRCANPSIRGCTFRCWPASSWACSSACCGRNSAPRCGRSVTDSSS